MPKTNAMKHKHIKVALISTLKINETRKIAKVQVPKTINDFVIEPLSEVPRK
ncbi:MAG: hypothetical protein IPK55_11355 [Streptococcus sp.]|nr:hypothetical protein [Streptococcus sp.]